MNAEEGLRTPSKGARASGSVSSPSTRSGKKATKNAKITNFFAKVNSPLNRNNSNSNQGEQSECENQNVDDLSKDASSSSMKMPCEPNDNKGKSLINKDYVFIIPSSDDDTNVSAKGSVTGGTVSRRRKVPSVHSNNSKSSDGLILTVTNNELGLGPKRGRNVDKGDTSSNPDMPTTPNRGTPTRNSGRDSRSRDSMPDKRIKLDNQNQEKLQTPKRIQPILLGSRTKMIDIQSVPSDLNLPRDQAASLIERLFLVKMPEDFFLFWEFAKSINHRKPCSAFSHSYLEWNLVGPYDVLSGLITDFHGFSSENLLRHCRYYYDPPEFQTVIIKKDSDLTHYGYYRDEPKQDNPIVVVNRAVQGGVFQECGDNLFTLLRSEIDTVIGSLCNSSQEIPPLSSSSKATRGRGSSNESSSSNGNTSFTKQSQLERAKAKQELTIIRDKLIDFCSNHENLSSESWSRTKTRQAKRCAKTFNTVGIVAPRSNDSSGSQNNKQSELGVTDSRLRTILTRISDFKDDKSKCSMYKDLNQLISNTNSDKSEECNAAMGLELGLDLLFQGDPYYHKDIEYLLTSAYTQLNRHEFVSIMKAHLEERRRGDKVSLLD